MSHCKCREKVSKSCDCIKDDLKLLDELVPICRRIINKWDNQQFRDIDEEYAQLLHFIGRW